MTHKSIWLIVFFLLFNISITWSQQQRWQQKVEYDMDILVDVKKHQLKGTQRLVYYNNSNEELTKVFYHLYFNAFQPNSMMDVRSRTIQDADPRVGSKIFHLEDEEIGYHKIISLKQNGEDVKFEVVGTILEVSLNSPIKAGDTSVFDMQFHSQVPQQTRRSGWNNAEGIEFSMSQWYPKMCEYDYQGWHSNPYVGREFHGVWGDFEVKITIDKNYILGGTGVLQNPEEIGHGYEPKGMEVNYNENQNLTWHFKAENVHDFVWAADPDYIHDIKEVGDGIILHFLYQENEEYKDVWKRVQNKTVDAFKFIQNRYGKYPYPQYSIIQAGDGGMEYPMATLITGKRVFKSLLGVIIHEVMHTWYQMLMGSNESLYAWMDEGFTSYTSNVVSDYLYDKNSSFPHNGSYRGYYYLANSGVEEPMTTHADHFKTNFAYGQAAYSKGAVFLGQLNYIVGENVFDKGMLRYYNEWCYKHPNPNDFIRVMEKESGLELDWYKEYWVNTTHKIDYSIADVVSGNKASKDSIVVTAKDENYYIQGGKVEKNGTRIYIEKKAGMPMPLDIVVTYTQGKSTKIITYNIPLEIMRGNKKDELKYGLQIVMPDWKWTHKVYELNINIPLKWIDKIEIDPSLRLADVDRDNNVWAK
ncbi:MAG: M1 family metallopeptidase [Saprospiraceae bacterium]|nr:M1 family metallopeptidase [Saprospiraceae bacterium]